MSDWQDATDPVPRREQLTDAQKRRRQAFLDRRRTSGMTPLRLQKAINDWHVPSDFDEMGA